MLGPCSEEEAYHMSENSELDLPRRLVFELLVKRYGPVIAQRSRQLSLALFDQDVQNFTQSIILLISPGGMFCSVQTIPEGTDDPSVRDSTMKEGNAGTGRGSHLCLSFCSQLRGPFPTDSGSFHKSVT